MGKATGGRCRGPSAAPLVTALTELPRRFAEKRPATTQPTANGPRASGNDCREGAPLPQGKGGADRPPPGPPGKDGRPKCARGAHHRAARRTAGVNGIGVAHSKPGE
ncbi:hypothetical protein Aau02nite_41050 [Amorphoplanes auranticolor]|uniref:Uncharacterized protein n=1 Tax=Actinoplanes auranticolor TaxID=47988 RepID=A0A919VNQ9_9ACTN|nr:hypothetical protein Aau02nite_41050 [Actinoplanes auranticolor]